MCSMMEDLESGLLVYSWQSAASSMGSWTDHTMPVQMGFVEGSTLQATDTVRFT